MKLILINNDPAFELNFKKYVGEWKNEKTLPTEDYYKLYKKVFGNYSEFITHLISLGDSKRLEEGKPYVRFYWFLNEADEIVGTIRYRVNIPEKFGNIGYEISPKHRNKGFGRKMLSNLINKLKTEKVDKLNLILYQDNWASKRIIEFNGGKFLKTIRDSERNENLNLYEIIVG